MSPQTNGPAAASASAEFNLVCGSGGSRAILGSSGAILACHLAGISNWRTLGGASGGSIPTALLAAGVHPTKIVHLTIELDFASLLTKHATLLQIFIANFLKDAYEMSRPARGVMGSEKLGKFIENFAPVWPKTYWTVAAAGRSQLLFTAEGVFEYNTDGMRQISREPAPLGLAVRASCAVPGMIDAVRFGERLLFDGALSIDGRCPIGVVKRNLKQAPETIIACDVGEDETRSARVMRRFWKVVCGSGCLREAEGPLPRQADGVVLIKPAPMKFRSLKFTLSRDQKWAAVMAGFIGAVEQLEKKALLKGDSLAKAREICRSFREIHSARRRKKGQLANRMESLLKSHGLY